MNGKVYLIGAGPGDPGLITVKALDCIKKADVIIYDYLIPSAILKHARAEAECIYVGKKGGMHTISQKRINALLLEKAKKGLCVARLKGGDPFIFGRGGEEAQELIKAGIAYEVVPGVTSAIAASAYAGIPLTHRRFTSTVAFVTGHEAPGKASSSIDWNALAKGIGTIVFLMGIKNLSHIVARLIDQGMSPQTPVAIIQWGTTPAQFTITGTLGTILKQVNDAGMRPPAIIVVGQVVSLREELKWFENRPLLGKRIVVTRAREQASELVSALFELGAECIEFPTIKVVPPDDWTPLDSSIEMLSEYDWLVFTSVNGVSYFFRRLFEKGKDMRVFGHVRTACIGPSTAGRLLDFGLKTDVLPETYRAESIIEAFRHEEINGKRILLPRAKEARPVLPVELTKMGALVDEVAAYQTEMVRDGAELLLDRLKSGTIDLITFTSSSTVKNFRALLPKDGFKDLLKSVTIASIGPVTSETARCLELEVHITAKSYTIAGLCEAILHHYQSDS
ncbi:MAG: uroporphyrinogen-III C-methyltransferase [Deltaproteobacteria bacterium]|nr:uroporphyrinogen-III C-methyltransferase [Deltaproteobacteria bacterium]MBW2151069.1 uroporphyrinogen-III C-methyltransferase [Deltaproteobacteria bacterium]